MVSEMKMTSWSLDKKGSLTQKSNSSFPFIILNRIITLSASAIIIRVS